MADGFADEAAALAVLAAVGAAVWYVLQGSFGSAQALLEDAQTRGESIYERVQEVSANGELVVDPISGVFYDDPEQGSLDDEAGDDRNVSFAAANELLAEVGEYIDPTSYAPDTEEPGTAPEGGVLSDPGESQVYGDAPEAENDDLNRVGNMDDETAAAFDRLANYDDAEQLDNDSDSDPASGGSTSTSSSSSTSTDDDLGGLESGSSYDRYDSGGSSSSGSSSSDSSDDDDGGYTFPGLSDDVLTQSESEDLTGDYSGGYVV